MYNNPSFSPSQQFQGNLAPINVQGDPDYARKVAILQKEFQEIDIDHNQSISRQELYSYLDRRSGVTFDRGIANEIFEQMDANQDQGISINEFIKVYLEAEDMLKKKIDASKVNIQSYKRQEEDSYRRSEEEKRAERLNRYGIDQGSLLYVTVVEGVNMMPAGGVSLFVEVSLDEAQRVSTKGAPSGSLFWDERFTFDIENPESVIKFTLLAGGTAFGGEVLVTLSELKDQDVRDVNLDLYDQGGRKMGGQLHVKLQWIHSKVRFSFKKYSFQKSSRRNL